MIPSKRPSENKETSDDYSSSSANTTPTPSTGIVKSAVPTKRKKRHTYGVYPCDHPKCNKVFQRSDHLSRHKLTHDSASKTFQCPWAGCGKKFNRSDTMKLHYNRHSKNQSRAATTKLEIEPSSKNRNAIKEVVPIISASDMDNPSRFNTEHLHINSSSHGKSNNKHRHGDHNKQDHPSQPQLQHNTTMVSKISNLLSSNFHINDLLNNNDASSMHGPPFTSTQSPMTSSVPPPQQPPIVPIHDSISEPIPSNVLATTGLRDISPTIPPRTEPLLQPSDILNFLFPEQIAPANGEYSSSRFPDPLEPATIGDADFTNIEQHSYNLFDPSQNMILHKLTNFPMSPSNLTTSAGSRTHIDQDIMESLVLQVPKLAINPDFHQLLLQRSMEIFWSLYNCRLAIIHKPSFDTRSTPPILLLAMIMMGAALSRTTDQIETVYSNLQKLAEDIAVPLRWLIFQSPELYNAKPWVLQSLIILETFEKHLSTRDLFQRSTIHHATKVQVLRRSTTLGGDPYRKDNFEAETLLGSTNKSSQLWNKWIELESMKRCAYATFIVDSYNAVLTTQTVALYAHQLKLSLQCDEELWLTLNFDQELLRGYEWQTQSYISTFIEMINEKSLTNYGTSAAVLLSGIITLIFLFQNTTSMKFQNSAVNESWRNMLTHCLESWLLHVKDGSCCRVLDLEKKVILNREFNATSLYLSKNDHRCKSPIYHMAHVLLRLSNYDWMTYSGSPLLMNVRADYTDYEAVCMRVQRWSRSTEGAVSVVNAYLLLIECLLPSKEDNPATFEPYKPEKDTLFERPYCLGQLSIIIWCFNYSLKGPESGFLDNEMNYTYYLNNLTSINSHVKEDGYGYLYKIQELFNRVDNKLAKTSSVGDTSSPSAQTKLYHRRLQMYGDAVVNLNESHHIAGFMLMLSEMFAKCVDVEMCLELSRLMKHCQSRSMGNKEIKCMNMYST